MRTLIAERSTSNVNLDSYTIETNEESVDEHLNNYPDFLEDNYVFTLTPVDFENLNGLSLVHPQLLDWDQLETIPLDTFQNDDAFIDYLGIQDDLPLGDHKLG